MNDGMSIYWMNSALPKLLNDQTFIPSRFDSVIDVGCGKGTTGVILKAYRDVKTTVGLEIFKPYLEHCEKTNAYDVLVNHDLNAERIPFDDKAFDLVLCLDVIEHLEKAPALKLLKELKRIGRKVVLVTPSYYQHQDELDGSEYQVHRCFISKKEFEGEGYKVRGMGNMKVIPINSWIIASLFPKWHKMFVCVFPGDTK